MWLFLYIFQVTLRIFIPLLMFSYPIPATIASMLLDVDAYAAQKAGFTWKEYHRTDKIMDFWFYAIIVLYCYGKPVFPIILALFIFRSIGQFLSFRSYKTKYLLLFPQIIDLYFLIYLFSFYLTSLKFFLTGVNNLLLIMFLFGLGLSREFAVHVWNISLSGFLGIKSSWKKDKNNN